MPVGNSRAIIDPNFGANPHTGEGSFILDSPLAMNRLMGTLGHLALKIEHQDKLEAVVGRCRLDLLFHVSGHSSSVLLT